MSAAEICKPKHLNGFVIRRIGSIRLFQVFDGLRKIVLPVVSRAQFEGEAFVRGILRLQGLQLGDGVVQFSFLYELARLGKIRCCCGFGGSGRAGIGLLCRRNYGKCQECQQQVDDGFFHLAQEFR